MILRRLTRSLQEQNWMAIIIEFVLLVAGVFLGLQVSNWNEARVEAAQEKYILAGIAQDLGSDRKELRTGAKALRASIGAGNYVLAGAGEPRIERLAGAAIAVPKTDDPGAEQRNGLWGVSVASFYPTGSVAAFDALTNSGKLGIIRDPDLVRALQDYRQKWRGLDETQAGTMRPLRNDAVSIGERYGLSPLTAFPEEELLRKVKEHEELRAALRTQIAFRTLSYSQVVELDQQAEAILAMIERKGRAP